MKSFIPSGSHEKRHSSKDTSAYEKSEAAFENSALATIDKLEAFPRFVTKRSIARFIAKYEIYQHILSVSGVVIECGVFNGGGIFTWAQLANIFEPVNHTRKIIGFDTFQGSPSVHDGFDNTGSKISAPGDLKGSTLDELELSIEKHNMERHLNHIPNVQLVAGDFTQTIDEFLTNNPHLIVALLYLDFDLYEPTKLALDKILPLMPKGAAVAFDELNCENFPGETTALSEVVGIGKLNLRRFPFEPWISYAIL